MKKLKNILAIALAAVIVVSSVPAYAAKNPSAGSNVPVEDTKPEVKEDVVVKPSTGVKVTVDTKADGTAAITEVAKTKAANVKIASAVVIDGQKYAVTKVSANLLENATKAKSVALPSTIKTIGAKAFSNAPETLKTIKITSKKAPTVSKTAFKGTDTSKMTIKVTKMTKTELTKLKKALKKAGYEGKIKVA